MLTHGRTRKRWLERAVIVLLVIAGAVFFVAWAIGLALLIMLLTY
jgi:ABC-type transporter Mla subunit MlaD